MPAKDWDRVHREDKYATGRRFAEYMEQLRDGPPPAGALEASTPEAKAERRRRARDAIAQQREESLRQLEEERRSKRLRDLERLDRAWSRRARKRQR